MTTCKQKKHPCPDCKQCQQCSPTRCSLCRGLGAEEAERCFRGLSMAEQIELFEAVNRGEWPEGSYGPAARLMPEPLLMHRPLARTLLNDGILQARKSVDPKRFPPNQRRAAQRRVMDSEFRTHTIELKAELAALEEMFLFLEKGCADLEVPLNAQRALELSADEAVTNVISYAYPEGAPGLVRLTLQRDHDEVSLTIEDQGRPFDESGVAQPDLDALLEDRKIGGLGVFLMHKMMDRVESTRKGDSNRLVLAKKI